MLKKIHGALYRRFFICSQSFTISRMVCRELDALCHVFIVALCLHQSLQMCVWVVLAYNYARDHLPGLLFIFYWWGTFNFTLTVCLLGWSLSYLSRKMSLMIEKMESRRFTRKMSFHKSNHHQVIMGSPQFLFHCLSWPGLSSQNTKEGAQL